MTLGLGGLLTVALRLSETSSTGLAVGNGESISIFKDP